MGAIKVLALCSLCFVTFGNAFIVSRPIPISSVSSKLRNVQPILGIRAQATTESRGSILVLDHLNINHQAGRHDLLKAFYFDVLGCALDPRKTENLVSGKKTLWANAGVNQFHLPEAETAQVLDGSIVLSYENLEGIKSRLASKVPDVLKGTKFSWRESADGGLAVTCPWGNAFELRAAPAGGGRDLRGAQPGDRSEAAGMPAIHIHVDGGADLGGVARFYEQLMGASVAAAGPDRVAVRCGPAQELVFLRRPPGVPATHSDYHISMYLQPGEFQSVFKQMEAAGLVFVNPRFKRQAHTLEEAVDQCMFRVRDIVDPAHPARGPILQLEHEIRSPIKADGAPYKSCPLKL